EREGDAEPVLAAPGRLELSRSHVHPNRPGAALGQPGGEVRRPAAELDDIQAADVTEHAELLLGHVEIPQVMSWAPRRARRAHRRTHCSPGSTAPGWRQPHPPRPREGNRGTTLHPARPAHTPQPALRASHSRPDTTIRPGTTAGPPSGPRSSRTESRGRAG